MHLNVICTVCEKNAQYNRTLGVYFCPHHGYETKLREAETYLNELVSTLEELKVMI